MGELRPGGQLERTCREIIDVATEYPLHRQEIGEAVLAIASPDRFDGVGIVETGQRQNVVDRHAQLAQPAPSRSHRLVQEDGTGAVLDLLGRCLAVARVDVVMILVVDYVAFYAANHVPEIGSRGEQTIASFNQA